MLKEREYQARLGDGVERIWYGNVDDGRIIDTTDIQSTLYANIDSWVRLEPEQVRSELRKAPEQRSFMKSRAGRGKAAKPAASKPVTAKEPEPAVEMI